MVVVAIRISLALKLFDYSKYLLRQKDHTRGFRLLVGCTGRLEGAFFPEL